MKKKKSNITSVKKPEKEITGKSERTNKKPGSLFSNLTFLIVGVVIGGLFGRMDLGEDTRVNGTPETVVPAPAEILEYSMLNPAVKSDKYKLHDRRLIPELEKKVKKIIDKSITAGKATRASVYFRDLTNDNWFGINETSQFSPASLFKVPVMIAVLKIAEEEPLILQERLIHHERRIERTDYHEAALNSTESILIVKQDYSIEKLLDIMVAESDNEATIMLIDYLEAKRPNLLIRVEEDLGVEIPDGANLETDFITVRKYSSFFRTLYNASYLSDEMSNKALDILTRSGYGYGIRQAVPLEIQVAHKYGIRLINDGRVQLHHFAIVYHKKKPFLLGIMTKGSNEENLKNVISSITEIALTAVNEFATDEMHYLARDKD